MRSMSSGEATSVEAPLRSTIEWVFRTARTATGARLCVKESRALPRVVERRFRGARVVERRDIRRRGVAGRGSRTCHEGEKASHPAERSVNCTTYPLQAEPFQMPVAATTLSAERMRVRDLVAWAAFVAVLTLGVVMYVRYAPRVVPMLDVVAAV